MFCAPPTQRSEIQKKGKEPGPPSSRHTPYCSSPSSGTPVHTQDPSTSRNQISKPHPSSLEVKAPVLLSPAPARGRKKKLTQHRITLSKEAPPSVSENKLLTLLGRATWTQKDPEGSRRAPQGLSGFPLRRPVTYLAFWGEAPFSLGRYCRRCFIYP